MYSEEEVFKELHKFLNNNNGEIESAKKFMKN